MKRDLAGYSARLRDPAEAEKYARRFERGSRRRIGRREQRAMRRVFSSLSDCRSVLDAPCGAGRFLPTLAQCCEEVLAADISPEILRFARRKAAEAGAAKARIFQADAARLPLEEGSVDAVFCNRLLHHILVRGERPRVLREFHRVSRRYAVVSFFNYRRFGAIQRWLKRLRGRRPPYERHPTAAEFAAEAAEAGFRVRDTVQVGPFWEAQEFYVLDKAQ